MGFADKMKEMAKNAVKNATSVGTVSGSSFPLGTKINFATDDGEAAMLFTYKYLSNMIKDKREEIKDNSTPKASCALFNINYSLLSIISYLSRVSGAFGGSEGNRTPVRKSILEAFYERIRFEILPPRRRTDKNRGRQLFYPWRL